MEKLMKTHRNYAKLIGQLSLIVLALGSVYIFSELSFVDNELKLKNLNYTLFQPRYTEVPVNMEQNEAPDRDWIYRRSSPIYLGFIPGYVMLMALGIMGIASSGFLLMLMAKAHEDSVF
jgi:hypothetical protein